MPESYNDRSSPNGPVGSTGGRSFPEKPNQTGSSHGHPSLEQEADGTAPLGSPVETRRVEDSRSPTGSGKRYWPAPVTSYPDGV